MRARSGLMLNLTEVIRERGMTQVDAATLFGVTQPRVSDVMRGKINLFSLDHLIDKAAIAGMTPDPCQGLSNAGVAVIEVLPLITKVSEAFFELSFKHGGDV